LPRVAQCARRRGSLGPARVNFLFSYRAPPFSVPICSYFSLGPLLIFGGPLRPYSFDPFSLCHRSPRFCLAPSAAFPGMYFILGAPRIAVAVFPPFWGFGLSKLSSRRPRSSSAFPLGSLSAGGILSSSPLPSKVLLPFCEAPKLISLSQTAPQTFSLTTPLGGLTRRLRRFCFPPARRRDLLTFSPGAASSGELGGLRSHLHAPLLSRLRERGAPSLARPRVLFKTATGHALHAPSFRQEAARHTGVPLLTAVGLWVAPPFFNVVSRVLRVPPLRGSQSAPPRQRHFRSLVTGFPSRGLSVFPHRAFCFAVSPRSSSTSPCGVHLCRPEFPPPASLVRRCHCAPAATGTLGAPSSVFVSIVTGAHHSTPRVWSLPRRAGLPPPFFPPAELFPSCSAETPPRRRLPLSGRRRAKDTDITYATSSRGAARPASTCRRLPRSPAVFARRTCLSGRPVLAGTLLVAPCIVMHITPRRAPPARRSCGRYASRRHRLDAGHVAPPPQTPLFLLGQQPPATNFVPSSVPTPPLPRGRPRPGLSGGAPRVSVKAGGACFLRVFFSLNRPAGAAGGRPRRRPGAAVAALRAAAATAAADGAPALPQAGGCRPARSCPAGATAACRRCARR